MMEIVAISVAICMAGKVTLGLHVARHMVAAGHWESAHMADMRVCVSASEAAYQLLAGATSVQQVHVHAHSAAAP